MKLLTHDDHGYRELTWSKTPPKEPGHYMYGRYSGGVFRHSYFNISLYDIEKGFSQDLYWHGPNPVPSPPQEEK